MAARKNKRSRGGSSRDSTNNSRAAKGGTSSSNNNTQRTGAASVTSALAPLTALSLASSNVSRRNNGNSINNGSTNTRQGRHNDENKAVPSPSTTHINLENVSNLPSPPLTFPSATSSSETITSTETAVSRRNLEILKGEFTTLDESLVMSIHYDDPLSLEKSRAILSHLSSVTILGEDDCPPTYVNEFPPESTVDEYTPTASSDWSRSDGSSRSGDGEEEDVSDLERLKTMFPSVKGFTIARALEKSPSGVDGAVDELLNRVFLDEEGEEEERAWKGVGKGVSGFSVADEDEGISKRKKGKWKERKPVGGLWIDTQTSSVEGSTGATAESRWKSIEKDISFLSASMHIPQPTVASACHAAGGDIAETVYRLLDKLPAPAHRYRGMMLDTDGDEVDQEKEVLDILETTFPDVERMVVRSLWRLVMEREWEVMQGVVSPPRSGVASPVGLAPPLRAGGWSVTAAGGGVGHFHAHPPRPPAPPAPSRRTPDEDESSISALFTITAILQNSPRAPDSRTSTTITPLVSPKSPTALPSRVHLPRPLQTITVNSRANTSTTTSSFFAGESHTLSTLTSSLQHALSMQSALSRRASRRNNLSSATAYYSEHAQAIGQRLRDMQVEDVLDSVTYDADGWAEVDLHGLRLAEGVRVAREVVEGFFAGCGGGGEGVRRRRGRVRIITGKGRHSKDGKGVLGPGVVKMLRGEGWRVEVGSGWVEVRGRERAR